MQNLDEYKRIKEAALGAEGVVDSDFEHMMETTVEQFKLLKINMKELVFPNLQEPMKKINEILQKINSNPVMQKGLFNAIIGTIGVGLLLTTLGTVTMLIGKMVSGYGKFLSYARDLTPTLVQNSAKLLEFIGLNSMAHNLTYGDKIRRSGNKLGLDLSNFSLRNGLFADIRRIDKNMRSGISSGFKELPVNITKSASSLKNWGGSAIKAMPGNFVKGLTSLKMHLLGCHVPY